VVDYIRREITDRVLERFEVCCSSGLRSDEGEE
jgi:hypothetical protein